MGVGVVVGASISVVCGRMRLIVLCNSDAEENVLWAWSAEMHVQFVGNSEQISNGISLWFQFSFSVVEGAIRHEHGESVGEQPPRQLQQKTRQSHQVQYTMDKCCFS